MKKATVKQKIFVDTSAWVALLVKKDRHHKLLTEEFECLLEDNNQLITSSLVLGETFTLLRLRYKYLHQKPFQFLQYVEQSNTTKTIYSSPEIEKQAIIILRKFTDHRFSYVDAVSFSIMERMGIKTALTLDKHFSIIGFKVTPHK